MQRNRLKGAEPVGEAQKKRDSEIRAKYATKPTKSELAQSDEYFASVKQGEYIALMRFAASLKRTRQTQKLSLADLAELSGIDKSAISRLENGQADNPTIGTLERLARSLGKRIRIEIEEDSPVG